MKGQMFKTDFRSKETSFQKEWAYGSPSIWPYSLRAPLRCCGESGHF